jgi:alpha-glucosidase (family GH31 glycosyl hydrolase)
VPSFDGENTDHTIVCGYQLGIFMPFFRAHSHEKNPMREPWVQSERSQKAIHEALDLRYQLFHYQYTTHYISTQSGLPLWRPMYYDRPQDEILFTLDTQFMYGSQLLVCPKLAQKFIKPNETISLRSGRKIIKQYTNTQTTPVYEIQPVLP